jgi:hypothetical protein
MVVTDPEPGDIVFFDWNKDGRYDHVGIFDSFQPSRIMFWTIEGNTSLSNQSNGGQVMRRVRNFKSNPVFVRPKHKA